MVEDQGRVIYRNDEILAFDVHDDGSRRGGWYGDLIGAVRPILNWETELVEETCLRAEA